MPQNVSRLRHRPLYLGIVGHVTHETKRLTAALLDVIGTPGGIFRLDIDTDNLRASVGQARSDAAADVWTGASYMERYPCVPASDLVEFALTRMATRRQYPQMAQALARHTHKEPHAYSTPDPVRGTARRAL